MKQRNLFLSKAKNLVKILPILFFTSSLIYAQTANIRVNRYWGSVNAAGTNTQVNYGATDLNLFADQGAYGMSLQANETYFGGHVALICSNWKDNKDGSIVPYALFPAQSVRQVNGLDIVVPLANYLRYASPIDSVYYQTSKVKLSSPNFGEKAVVDPSKCIGTSDQTVTTTNKYFNDVTVARKVLAWGQQLNDNYVITDYTFTNNSTQTLNNFYIFYNEGNYYLRFSDGNTPAVAAVDNFYNAASGPRRWYHYYGSRTSDSLRIFYEYFGDDPEKAGDNMGQPLTEQQGRLRSKDFWFSSTLHASTKPYKPAGTAFPAVDANDADDMNQPSVTTTASHNQKLGLNFFGSQTAINDKGYFDLATGTTLASEDMTGADVRPGHHRKNNDELGKSAPGGEVGMDPLNILWGNMIYSYGPYTFAPGEQIRIVRATGFAGISRELAVEVGKKWMNKTLTDPPNLPNATTGYFPSNFAFPTDATENDKKKDRWISLGIKEMHATVSRAKQNFKSGYNIPVTPAPPTKTVVKPLNSGGIQISWQPSVSESTPGFVGYRLFKKISTYDTVYYKLVYQGKTPSFFDTKVRPSPKYFYHIQAGVKYNADTLWSSKFWRYNTNGTSASTTPNTGSMDNIVIAPNPFNYRDPVLTKYLFQSPKNLTLTFFNLPPQVTISLYTENGDLVRTVQSAGTGDYKMKMVNESGQAIASGVYVVVFQTPDGGFSYQKLVVAR
jgi:hypothetical protein